MVPGGASPPDRVRLEGSWQDSHGWGVFKYMGTRSEGVAGGRGCDPDRVVQEAGNVVAVLGAFSTQPC